MLDAGNSGSTMRMLAGILAAQPFSATITGDESLRRRPMRRIIVPLERMGARIGSEDGRPPLTIQGTTPLQPSTFTRRAQRPGQERRAAGRSARRRRHDASTSPWPRAIIRSGRCRRSACEVRARTDVLCL